MTYLFFLSFRSIDKVTPLTNLKWDEKKTDKVENLTHLGVFFEDNFFYTCKMFCSYGCFALFTFSKIGNRSFPMGNPLDLRARRMKRIKVTNKNLGNRVNSKRFAQIHVDTTKRMHNMGKKSFAMWCRLQGCYYIYKLLINSKELNFV